MNWTAIPPSNPHTDNWTIVDVETGELVAVMRGGLVEQEGNAKPIASMAELAADELETTE